MFPIPDKFEPTNNYVQLELFPMTPEQTIRIRMDEMDSRFRDLKKTTVEKTERLRKGQYAEIGALKKRCLSLEERLEAIERGLCRNELVKNDCEVFHMAVM